MSAGVAESEPPIVIGRSQWKITEFSVSNKGAMPEGTIYRCDIEVIEAKRQFYRAFTLFYMNDWFNVWEVKRNNCQKVAGHAHQWLAIELAHKRPGADYSCHSPAAVTHIFM